MLLVVDDEEGPRASLKVVFKNDFEVLLASNGREALEIARDRHIDVAILPINGKVGNMDGIAAARLAKDIGAKVVIPCHYEMFEFNTASPESFVKECRRLNQPCKVLRAGERYTMWREE